MNRQLVRRPSMCQGDTRGTHTLPDILLTACLADKGIMVFPSLANPLPPPPPSMRRAPNEAPSDAPNRSPPPDVLYLSIIIV